LLESPQARAQQVRIAAFCPGRPVRSGGRGLLFGQDGNSRVTALGRAPLPSA